ncbi:hypothetical protein [Bosea vestrisii]|uniref:Uncharacterized protein n=1 Tax=Bosea vestrisii TaxID=151416 RepID=A0ABW0H723_9HYPH
MRLSRWLFAAALAATVAYVAPVVAPVPIAVAVAQEQSTRVDLAPAAIGVLGYVSVVIGAVVATGLSFLGARLYAWTGINIEARHREALHSAIMTGVNAALGKVADLIGGRAIDVRSTAVAEALRYVGASVPDAIRYFGLTQDRLSDMIAAKLAQIERERFSVEPVELRSSIAVDRQAG